MITDETIEQSEWTTETIRTVLIEVLTEIQETGGSNLPEFLDSLCIMTDIHRFDSIIAIESLVELSDRFEVELPDDLYVHPKTQKPLTLEQTVERIYEIIHASED